MLVGKEIKSETSSSVLTLLEHHDQNHHNQNELFTSCNSKLTTNKTKTIEVCKSSKVASLRNCFVFCTSTTKQYTYLSTFHDVVGFIEITMMIH